MAHKYTKKVGILTPWDMVEIILEKESKDRTETLIEKISAWFKDRSAFFRLLEKDSLIGMIKYSSLLKYRPDHVVIRQGEMGDCFYVIVRGSVSVFARPNRRNSRVGTVAKDIFVAHGVTDRLRFGNELAQLTAGRCFGELAVLSDNGERNASVITDEPTVLICFKRETFLQFVHEKFANELLRKSGFVHTNPLFKKWPSAYKNLLTECLQIKTVPFGEMIVEQGTDVTSIHFVIAGQTKVSVNTQMHLQQYKRVRAKWFDEYLASFYGKEIDENDDTFKFPILQRRKQRLQDGFFANEMRQRPELDLCVLTANTGLIGDIEAVYELPTYSTSYHCLETVTTYELDITSFVRLIIKKNPDTFENMRKFAEAKLRFRNSVIKGGIPLYTTLLEASSRERLAKLGTTNLISRLVGMQNKKDERRLAARGIPQSGGNQQEKSDERRQSIARMQKMKISSKPVTREATMREATMREATMREATLRELTIDEEQRNIIKREGTRRGQLLMQREATVLPAVKDALPNSAGEKGNALKSPMSEDQRRGESRETVSTMAKFKQARMKAANLGNSLHNSAKIRASHIGNKNKKKPSSLDNYVTLKKQMQCLTRVNTNRSAWTG